MTTMGSDSESQDSDEGRRFRFEATRKDTITDVQRHRTSTSPQCNTSKHKTRDKSRDRARYSQWKGTRRIPDSTKEHADDRNKCEERRSFKEEKTTSGDSRRKRESGNKDIDAKKTYKTSRACEKMDCSSRDEKRKRSHGRNRDKKNSDKLRKYSRERNKLSQKEESFRLQKSCDQKIKNQDTEKFKIIDLKSDSQDCKDLNLSDFDIVSDTEENLGKSEEIIEPENYQMKNRHRNETNNQKVKLRNGDESSGSYLSNPDEISDFVLTPTPTKTVSAIYHDKLLCKNEEAGFPNLNPKESDQDVNKHDNIVKKIYGPALPPSVESLKCNALKNIPPNLSSHLKNSVIHDDNDKADNTFGPHLPQHFRKSEKITDDNDLQDATSAETTEDDDDGFVGPLPTDHPRLKDDFVQQQLQYRAQLLKKQLAEIDDEELPKREEWMTELPTIKGVNFGLEARKFRMRAGPDLTDRSDWTDSPADRAKKKSATSKMAGNTEYFQEIRRPLANKKKEKSLLDIHRKKIHAERKKKEKDRKKSGKREDRRPFNRDIDLQVNRLSEAHKSSMLLKAAQLDDRFLQGKI